MTKEWTEGQWYNVMGGGRSAIFTDAASRAFRPMENVAWEDIRGTAAQGGGDWPANSDVYASSFIGLLRTKAGSAGFDLPTEAQWECACRAGKATVFNDGDANVNVIGANFNTNAALNNLGRYKFDGGYLNGTAIPLIDCGPTNGTAIVGSYLPNAWSLYDMHGNVLEWCLDWYLAALPGGTDPRGAATGTMRMVRGGCWSWEAGYCRSAYRYYYTPSDKLNNVGFRLVLTLP